MKLRDKLNQLLAAISSGSLVLNERNSCQFLCTNGLKCFIEPVPETDRVLAYIPVKRVADNLSLRIRTLEKALSCNLLLQQTSALSLVFDERVNQIMLSTYIDLENCDLDEFDQWISCLIKRSKTIKEELDRVDLGIASRQQPAELPNYTPINQVVKQAVMVKL